MQARLESVAASTTPAAPSALQTWIALPIAALAMVATFPGRTFGVGLITESLIADLGIGRVTYAQYNLWATLIGAAFCLPIGRANDRIGPRVTLAFVALALASSLFFLTHATTSGELFSSLILLRGFGQSALSIVSLAILAKWYDDKLPLATGLFTIGISMGFATMFGVVGYSSEAFGWRMTWSTMGGAILLLAPLGLVFLWREPDLDQAEAKSELVDTSYTLLQAARTGTFWLFGLSSAVFAMISSGLLLFQESILASLGFDKDVYLKVQIVSLLTGLCANFLAGWLGSRVPLERILAFGMAALATTLVYLPRATSIFDAYAYGAAMGAAGGIVTVIFFTAWPRAFGQRHVGHVQGAAQLMTVLASAAGPLVLAECFERTGRYDGVVYAAAVSSVFLAVWAGTLRTRSVRSSG